MRGNAPQTPECKMKLIALPSLAQSVGLGRVVCRKTVMLLGLSIRNLREHTLELLAAAPRCALSDIAVREQELAKLPLKA